MFRLSASKSAITKVQTVALIVVIVVAIIAGVSYWLITRPPAAGTIKIGYTAPFTGSAAEFGVNGWRGVETALDEINEEGIEIGGTVYTIDIIRYDDVCTPTEGVANVMRLITEDEVCAILGSHCSSVCLAIEDRAREYEVPMITIECMADELTRKDNEYYFRAWPSSSIADAYPIEVVGEEMMIESISYLAINDDYGRSEIAFFKEGLEEYGVVTKSEDYFERGTTDFMAYLTEIKSLEPDLMYFVGVTPEAAMIVKQSWESDLKDVTTLLGSVEAASAEMVDLAGVEAIEGVYVTTILPSLEEPKLAELADKITERYDAPMHYAIVYGYDLMCLIAEAIETAGSFDPNDIRDAIDEIEYSGVIGLIKFEDRGGYTNQAWIGYHVAQWTEGELEVVW